MNKFKIKLDPKYTKICIYAIASVVVTAALLMILFYSGSFWVKLWGLFKAVLTPVIIGGVIDYLLSPLVKKAEQGLIDRGFSRSARYGAVAIVIILTLAVLFGIIAILAVAVYQTVSSIGSGGFKELLAYMQGDFSEFFNQIEVYLEMIGLSPNTISNMASAAISSVSSIASGLLFGVIFSIYFMLDGNNISNYWRRVVKTLYGNRSHARFDQFLKDADRVFSGYIRGQFIDAAIIGILTTIAMIAIGVPNGTVVGVLTGCGNLIPYIGPVVGYVTLALVCIPSAAWTKLIIGAVALAVLLFVDGNIINPKLLSSNVMVHPLLVVAALIGGGAIGGILGMLISVPVAALLKVQLDRYLDWRDVQKSKTRTEAENTAGKQGQD